MLAFVVVLFLNACTSSSSLGIPRANTAGDPGGLVNAPSKPGPALYVLNSGSGTSFDVSVYAAGGATHLRNISIGHYGDGFTVAGPWLYVAYPTDQGDPGGSGSLSIYSSRGAKPVRTLKQNHPFGSLAVDSSKNLFTLCASDRVCEYADSKQNVIRKIALAKFGFSLTDMAVDASGDLAISSGSAGVIVFAPGKAAPYWSIGKIDAGALAFDASGNLYVANDASPTSVAVYAPNGQAPIRIITDGVAFATGLALDTSNNLYVLSFGIEQSGSCSQPPSVTEYPAGQTQPIRTITNGIACDQGHWLALDAAGNIYVSNLGYPGNSGNVVVYAPGSDNPIRTVTTSISNPSQIGIGP